MSLTHTRLELHLSLKSAETSEIQRPGLISSIAHQGCCSLYGRAISERTLVAARVPTGGWSNIENSLYTIATLKTDCNRMNKRLGNRYHQSMMVINPVGAAFSQTREKNIPPPRIRITNRKRSIKYHCRCCGTWHRAGSTDV